jgi:type IV pilus assembly protein PilN
MRIRLNLATKPLVAHRKFVAGSALLGVVAFLVFLGLGWHVYLARKANAEMREKTAKIQQEVSKLAQERAALELFFHLDENAKLHDRAAYINSLIDARSFNWTMMFMDLERVLPAGVRVVSIEPKLEKGRVEVKFAIGATTNEAELKFIKALEESKTFSHVQLSGSHVSTTGTGGDPIVVELTAEYSRT